MLGTIVVFSMRMIAVHWNFANNAVNSASLRRVPLKLPERSLGDMNGTVA